MPEPTLEELSQSINELSTYRNRLHTELTKMATKLQMNPKKIQSTLESHKELKNIELTISALIKRRDLAEKKSC